MSRRLLNCALIKCIKRKVICFNLKNKVYNTKCLLKFIWQMKICFRYCIKHYKLFCYYFKKEKPSCIFSEKNYIEVSLPVVLCSCYFANVSRKATNIRKTSHSAYFYTRGVGASEIMRENTRMKSKRRSKVQQGVAEGKMGDVIW